MLVQGSGFDSAQHIDWVAGDAHDCFMQTLSLSDKVRTKLFGLKTAAEKETSRQRRLAVEAQWRAEYESKQVCIPPGATCNF